MGNIKNIEKILTEWQHSTMLFLPKVFLALLVLIVFYFLARFFKKLSIRFYSRTFKKHSDVVTVISIAIYCFFILSGIFLGLEILGLENVLTHLLAGAGIIGIVAGFAFKDIVSNTFASFLLSIQRPFKVGHWVKIDTTFGTVKEIGWITTSVITIEGQEVFVPNQLVYSNTFTNYSTLGKRRIIMKSGVSYGDNLEHVKRVALDEVKKIDSLLKKEAVDFYFTGIGSSTYNFEIRFWVHFSNQVDYLNAMNETIMRIKKRFEEEDICIAYSVTTLDFGVKGGINLFDKTIQTQAITTTTT